MIKPILCEGCSVLIALVLVVADCRHLTAEASEPVASVADQIAPDARHILQIDYQSRNAAPGMSTATGNDLVRQLSGWSALYTARVTRQPSALAAKH